MFLCTERKHVSVGVHLVSVSDSEPCVERVVRCPLHGALLAIRSRNLVRVYGGLQETKETNTE